MEMQIIGFKITFIKNIGEISEQKIKMLFDEFDDKLPDKNIIPEGIILSNNVAGLVQSLLVTPTQTAYSEEGNIKDIDFEKPKSIIKNICDKLYLNDNLGVLYNFTCLIDGKEHSNMLKNKLDMDLNMDSIKGVGIRVFLDNENYSGIFSFEPYLRSLDKYFCSLELQLKKQASINEVIEYGKNESLNLFNEMAEKVYNNL
ncbi:hypothetical protein [Clostridium beijerinckii]|uniref:hypothetical protein n=1 Tax=Clostridium beijerinckii TaxID=1520 RepID=UPI00243255B1|nr:hypothetical protein [Clostridium beijerinckii]MDG5856015.1 hypothetical protein [Clostridium beijerinckii]